ncbi:uncharacterized protein SAPINGB_P004729 [Magnusiomyces paraingens]|uniref:DUF218 domain-containing protein n=1 Tax=Magnusiomyces paraingens TaxID=2606893 RepID=A0A5E8BYR1_9ASCO|nr:uncharacterized protein SAPINGB_P004729 [Saprochaete ingens]VVT55769.1 unnamed protein product [Saprochaete ingens]
MRMFFQKKTVLIVFLAFVITYTLWSYVDPSYDNSPLDAPPIVDDSDDPTAKKTPLKLNKDIARVHKSLNRLDRLAIEQMLPPPPPQAQNATHLVIVPGHAVFMPRRSVSVPEDASQLGALVDAYAGESPPVNVFSGGDDAIQQLGADDSRKWLVAPFQRGQTATFMKHIQTAAGITRKDKSAILVLSGGQTNVLAGPYSEGASYWSLAALALNEYDRPQKETEDGPEETLVNRMVVEEHATDSYENLLFSIARFKEYVGQYPEIITIVGLELKRERFAKVHRAAIRFPAAHFRYVGVDPPELFEDPGSVEQSQPQQPSPESEQNEGEELNQANEKRAPEEEETAEQKDGSAAGSAAAEPIKGAKYAAALEGERQNALLPFTNDPYGCTDPVLTAKRRKRNPFRRTNPYLLSCPELYELFTVCARDNLPKEDVFDALPWNIKPPQQKE